MSFRDNRNFVEMLRALGYPELISMESFRTPNFTLVANLLQWLTRRFDPEADLHSKINTEEDRVKLIRSVAHFMAIKANIKLNTRRLYQADGYAIKELLKITSLLYEALEANSVAAKKDYGEKNILSSKDFDISDKIGELKISRQLASEITSTGATLFDLLAKESQLKLSRQKSVSRQFEINDIETGIKKSIEEMKNEIQELKDQRINNVSLNEVNLDAKIERRKAEIDRYEKRLQTLKKVRPAFLDEFIALEHELESLFEQYSIRLRSLQFLEKQLSDQERAQYQKQIQNVPPKVEIIPLEANASGSDFLLSLEDSSPPEQKLITTKPERPRAGTGGRSRLEKHNPKVFGGMDLPNDNSLDLSSESDSSALFFDKDEDVLNSDDESFVFDFSQKMPEKRAATGRRTTSSKVQSNSDDDF